MRRSHYFLPTLKEDPSEAQIVSHRLMLRSGMIRQSSAGIYSWLPLGFRVLKKIEQIVREEQDNAGAQEILMPTIQSADLWIKSGRYEDYGKEMLRIRDRHEHEMLYGPTNEELITDIFAQEIKSYRDLPKNLYHIQWKFRDEIRPRFGVMRGREFYMKDAYSFDLNEATARISYNKMFISYLRTFARMGLKAIPMSADTGPIGGDLSHEFIILAETGESNVFCDRALLERDVLREEVNYTKNLQPMVDSWTKPYAATDEKYDETSFNSKVEPENRVKARGIEVGHIFFFGTKYSEILGAFVATQDGERCPVHMGSYGIGVSRLVGAIIEASHDDAGIIWPEIIAPFHVGLINLKVGDPSCDAKCEELYIKLKAQNIEVLYDDRNERAGVKFAEMDLIGLPWQLIVGPKSLGKGMVEVRSRRKDVHEEILSDSVFEFFV